MVTANTMKGRLFFMIHFRTDQSLWLHAMLAITLLSVGLLTGCKKEDLKNEPLTPEKVPSTFSVHLGYLKKCDDCSEYRDKATQQIVYIAPDAIVTLRQVTQIKEMFDANGRPAILLTFNKNGADSMKAATQEHIGQWLAMKIDSQIVSLPVVQSTLGRLLIIAGDDIQLIDIHALINSLTESIPES